MTDVPRWLAFLEHDWRAEGLFGGARPAPSPAAYTDALLAGWVPPHSEIPVEAGSTRPASGEKPDVAAFLSRFYLNQQC